MLNSDALPEIVTKEDEQYENSLCVQVKLVSCIKVQSIDDSFLMYIDKLL